MLTLRAHAAVVSTAALVAVIGVARIAQPPLRLEAFYPAVAGACFGIVAGLVIVFCHPLHPFPRLGPANLVTMARAGLVALLAALIGEAASSTTAAAITVVSLMAASLDGVDGWLARRTRSASAFGARFDMEVDALLILVLSVLVWRYHRAGAWVLLAGLLRYGFVAAGWFLPWLQRPLPPSVRRQAICVVQIGGLIVAMAPWPAPGRSAPMAALALLALSYSFLIDLVWLWRERFVAWRDH